MYRNSQRREKVARLMILTALALAVGLFVASAAQAGPTRRLAEHPRSLAMGGTGVSFANDEMALYYNPAGLGAVDNFWVELLPITLEASNDAVELAKTGEFGSFDDPAGLIRDFTGKELQLRGLFTPHVLFNISRGFTFGYGYFLEYQAELQLRNQATPEIDAFYREDKGRVAAVSFPMKGGKFLGGLALRQIERKSGEGTLSSAALAIASVKGDLDLTEELEILEGKGTGYDVGLIWRLEMLSKLRGQFGMSILNAGGTDLKGAGKIPQEVSFGWAFAPKLAPGTSTLFALEFRDVSGEFGDDKSTAKRTHMGFEFGLVPLDRATNLVTVRLGSNSGYLSYGVELALWHSFSIAYVVYTEEYGDVAGEDPRERKLLQANLIGF